MTKTIKLTNQYIDIMSTLRSLAIASGTLKQGYTYPTVTGDIFSEYDRANLMVVNTCYKHEDIKSDNRNVPLYKLKNNPKRTADFTSIHSIVDVELYTLKDRNSTIEVPTRIFDRLVGIVEEIT